MKRRWKMAWTVTAAMAVCVAAWAVKTQTVEFGLDGAYDGAVTITRDEEGNLVFRDEAVTEPVTLEQLALTDGLHSALSGLSADDHPQYLNAARHNSTHDSAFNDALAIAPDLAGNSTLGAHAADTNIHLRKGSAETITGDWKFSAAPEMRGNLKFSFGGGDGPQKITFENGSSDAELRWSASLERFETNKLLYAPQAAFDEATIGDLTFSGSLDGAGSGTLDNWAEFAGIDADNLLDKAADEDIAGSWDFLGDPRANLLKALTSAGLALQDASGTLGLQVADGGNVGAGVSSPGDSLDVSGDLRVRGNTIKSGSGGTAAIELSGADVETLGDLKVSGGDIRNASGTALATFSSGAVVLPNATSSANGLRIGSASGPVLHRGAASNSLTVGNLDDVHFDLNAGKSFYIRSSTATSILVIGDDGIPHLYTEEVGSAADPTTDPADAWLPIFLNDHPYYIPLYE